jgi:hypothetical protein
MTTNRLEFKLAWKLATLLILMMVFSSPATAQDCTPDDIVLDTQSDVNNFQADHGPCDHVDGKLTIDGNDIVNLAGLSGLSSVDDLLIANNPLLMNVDGLSGLTAIFRDLEVSHNGDLIDLDGLAGVTEIGRNILIWDNDELEDLDGLTRLTGVEGSLNIRDNSSLFDLDGLSRIVTVGGDMSVESNGSIENLDGLIALVNVGGTFRIQTENLIDIDGLSRLSRVGGRLIVYNTTLSDVDGLSGVASAGSDLWIALNSQLRNLDGLAALSAARNVAVEDNPRLDDCQGLLRLLDPIDHDAPGPGPGTAGIPDVADKVSIQNNRAGCNSIFDILGGAEFFAINTGLNDAWFNPETPGQGFFIIVLPHLKQIFMAWFTYDTERPPADFEAFLGEPGHRWLTAQGTFAGNSAVLTVFLTSGGVFNSPLPAPVTAPDGEILLEFSGCNAGTVTFDIPSLDLQGVVPVERIAPDNIAQCYLLGNPLPDTP